MKELNKMLKAFWTDEDGVTVIEYAVLAALIIVACITVIGVLGTQINEAFESIRDELAESEGVDTTS
ncbi:MAG: Flp family type IVb pilin [Desulfuromonadales bacterium]